jgi:hypothetical protein
MTLSIIKPPTPFPFEKVRGVVPRSVFLAGSIEQGAAEDWQTKVIKHINDEVKTFKDAYYIFNPRRDSWDASWVQSIDNPQFNEQVNWELTALDISKKILMYFDPNTKSPISLLELGLYANSRKLIVCCPNGFWRKGNVDIVCKRYEIPLYSDLDRACYYITDHL